MTEKRNHLLPLFDSRQGQGYFFVFYSVQTGRGTHPDSIHRVPGFISPGSKWPDCGTITHLHLVPRLHGPVPQLHHTSWHIFVIKHLDNFTVQQFQSVYTQKKISCFSTKIIFISWGHCNNYCFFNSNLHENDDSIPICFIYPAYRLV
jgi:hypothetical protein